VAYVDDGTTGSERSGDARAVAGRIRLSKSAVSRRFVALSTAHMKKWLASDLSGGMSAVLPHLEITPQRPGWLAEDVVLIGPVSGA
jgi:hypothetical protein